jgi:hypothetical protein
MTDRVCNSETSVYFREYTRRCIPERCHLHTRRRENLTFIVTSFVTLTTGNGVHWQALLNAMKFSEQFSDYQLLKKVSFPRS